MPDAKRWSLGSFHPLCWTVATWLAVLLWLWYPLPLNIPPTETYTIDSFTGEWSGPTRYESLSELPFPVGWPLRYVRPSDYDAMLAEPLMFGEPLPELGPTTVHPWMLIANLVLILVAISALVYTLQSIHQRTSWRVLAGLFAFVPSYILLGRLVAAVGGYDVAVWYSVAVYFSPVLFALGVRFRLLSRLPAVTFPFQRPSIRRPFAEFRNPEDAIAAASQLEMSGDWADSIDLYRRAAERWPEHWGYAQCCIERVTHKRSLVRP